MNNNKNISLTDSYNYKDRLTTWIKYATKNKVITNCEKCHKTHAHKSVLLENGENVCWYCWIRKDLEHGKVVVKPNAKPQVKKETPKVTKAVSKPAKPHAVKASAKRGTEPKVKKPAGNFNESTATRPLLEELELPPGMSSGVIKDVSLNNTNTKPAEDKVDTETKDKSAFTTFVDKIKHPINNSKTTETVPPVKEDKITPTKKPVATQKKTASVDKSTSKPAAKKTSTKAKTGVHAEPQKTADKKADAENESILTALLKRFKIAEKSETKTETKKVTKNNKSTDTKNEKSKIASIIDKFKPANFMQKCKHECGYVCHDKCDHDEKCKICKSKSQVVQHSYTPVESKYTRLSGQPQSERFSLYKTKAKVTRGKCSFDPKADYAIEMLNIHKSFLNGKVVANDGIDLRVRKNEVHAIIGENGAGKSTLMSILFGIYSPDEGSIKVNGENVFFSSAKDASKVGLGMVHQHFQLVPTYTVLENVILGSEVATLKLGYLQNKQAQEKIAVIVDKYKLNLDLNEKISNLTVGQQQKTEILKLLYRNASILIFDEPTAVLSPDEIEQFLNMVRDLKAEGKTIIIITHKFNEIKTVADRATVIRLGTFISDFNIKDKTIEQMAAEMIGRELVDVKNTDHSFKKDVILEVEDLKIKLQRNKEKEVPPLNFKIHAGEVFAIAGVEGNGQSELVQAISGLDQKYEGKIILNGVDISKASIEKRDETGLSHIPENRHKHGLILDLPIYMNAISNEIDKQPFSKYGFVNETQIKEYTRNLIKKFDIRGSTRGTSMARGLSGGNQQKLIVARELSHDNQMIIMMQPTRGLDLGAVTFIHEKIIEEKAKGHAVLLVSYELDEILSLADTIAVMSDGVLLETNDTKHMTRSRIGQLMAGKE